MVGYVRAWSQERYLGLRGWSTTLKRIICFHDILIQIHHYIQLYRYDFKSNIHKYMYLYICIYIYTHKLLWIIIELNSSQWKNNQMYSHILDPYITAINKKAFMEELPTYTGMTFDLSSLLCLGSWEWVQPSKSLQDVTVVCLLCVI